MKFRILKQEAQQALAVTSGGSRSVVEFLGTENWIDDPSHIPDVIVVRIDVKEYIVNSVCLLHWA